MGCAGIRALKTAGYRIAAVYTHAGDDAAAGESVAALCEGLRIPTFIFEGNEQEELVRMVQIAPDFLFSFYYRALLPDVVLSVAKRGAFNLHGSLLPKYRGRAPVNWVLVNGESETGVSLHYMTSRADAGDIVGQAKVAIADEDDARTLQQKLLVAGAELLKAVLPLIAKGTAPRQVQDLAAGSYFGRRTPDDGRIDWKRGASVVRNLVRAVARPFPGAFSAAAGRKFLVWEAVIVEGAGVAGEVVSVSPLIVACGEGAVCVVQGQVDDGVVPGAVVAEMLGLRVGEVLG